MPDTKEGTPEQARLAKPAGLAKQQGKNGKQR